MKKFLAGVAAALIVCGSLIVLSSCSPRPATQTTQGSYDTSPTDARVQTVILPDGSTVYCIILALQLDCIPAASNP